MKKICFITTSRADFGTLDELIKIIEKKNFFKVQLIISGSHFDKFFGKSENEINISKKSKVKKIRINCQSKNSKSVALLFSTYLNKFSKTLSKLKPDIFVVIGDRYEILAASTAALFARIPVGHIHGGETTEGAFDEAIRHSLTKMAWWHFVAADEYENRVIQLGEDPARVFNVGGLGVDAIKKIKLLSKKELIKNTGIQFRKKNLLVTYHPVTLEKQTSQKHFQVLLDVLQELKNVYLIFTMPNADSDGRIIKKMINEFTDNNKERSISFTSMGRLKYLSTLQFVDGVIGNSSSGLAEAPTFKVGTINIGDRQKGRLKADSVIDCNPDQKSITTAIKKLYSNRFQNKLKTVSNPYGKGKATEKIMKILKKIKIPDELKKEFYDL